MQIFVSGVWGEEKAKPFALQGRHLGELIAKAGFDLACGPGTGVARFVIDGYHSVSPRGIVRFYLPITEEMLRVGEVASDGADEIIQTEYDYPLRNIYQVKCSDALFILSGGDSTLQEALAALAEYELPVVGLRESGTAVRALELLLPLYPVWSSRLVLGDNIDGLFEKLCQMVQSVS